jgi:hypothetical protein
MAISPQDAAYMALGYQQEIDMLGTPVTYYIASIPTKDEYEHPIITYTPLTIIAVIGNNASDIEYEFTEEGFLPSHYAKLWVYQVTPQVGDRVLWKDLMWEVRNSIPRVIGSLTLYYDVLIRRVIAPSTSFGPSGTLQAGGDGTTYLQEQAIIDP